MRGATEPGSRNGAFIASITGLAHALGMDTTAEGVETLDELDLVRMYGCSNVQGYIYERALDAASATQRLQTGLAAVAKGPRSARSSRHVMLRKVVLDHAGHRYDGTIRIWPLDSVKVEQHSSEGQQRDEAPVTQTAIVTHDASASDLEVFRHPGAVLSVAVSPDGQMIASGCDDSRVRLWVLQE